MMRALLFCAHSGHGIAATVIMAILACYAKAGERKQQADTEPVAAQLVRAAVQSDLAGERGKRESLLREALAQAPEDATVRWQLGQVRVDGTWRAPAEIEQASRRDKTLTEYERLR